MADPVESSFVVSLDFELYWGVRDKRSLDDYKANLLGARNAIPRMLEVFERYGIHATWATVGFLFFDGRDELLAHVPPVQPRYANPRLSPYPAIEKLGASEAADPFHFAPSLIRRIAATPHQEIGTHTLSHYYCLEAGQDRAAFAADLDGAVAAARRFGLEIRSLVFPRNQVNRDYLPLVAEAGIIAYRGNESAWMYQPARSAVSRLAHRAGRIVDTYVPLGVHGSRPKAGVVPVDIPSSRFLRPRSSRLAALEPLRQGRILHGMRQAASRGETFHLWWHPHNFGVNTDDNLAVLTRVCEEYRRLQGRGMRSRTMAEAARVVLARAA